MFIFRIENDKTQKGPFYNKIYHALDNSITDEWINKINQYPSYQHIPKALFSSIPIENRRFGMSNWQQLNIWINQRFLDELISKFSDYGISLYEIPRALENKHVIECRNSYQIIFDIKSARKIFHKKNIKEFIKAVEEYFSI